MTLEEAKKILKEEGFKLSGPGKPGVVSEYFAEYESPEICEAMQIVCSAGFLLAMLAGVFDERKARLKEEYEKNTKAPDFAENRIKEDSGVNPALKEASSQFNDALLDEQAKKIEKLAKENERLKDQIAVLDACKKHNDKIDRLQIKRLGKEIARLNGIIHDKNEEIKRKTKGCCELVTENVDLKKKLSDKDAVLSDVAEELRLSKIREKNLTEVSQKYMKENEELREKVAEKTKLVEMVRKGSKEYCEYGIAEEKMIQKMAKDIVNDRPVSPKDYEQYRLWAKGYRFNPQLPERTDKEEKKLNTAKSTLDDLKKKAYESFNAKACNLGLVGSKDGNGIIDQMIGVDIAEEGADLSGVFVLCGKDFIDALKKVKDVWQE